jgi:hypothetical protein
MLDPSADLDTNCIIQNHPKSGKILLGTVSWVGQNRLHRGVPQLEVPVRERTLVCRPQSAVGEVRIQILPVDNRVRR